MFGFAILHRHIRLHQRPDLIGNRDSIAIQIHAESGDDIGFGAKADGRAQGLPRQHVRPIQFAGDHPVQQNFPVRLRLQRDIQAFILKKSLLIGDRQRRHVG